MPNLRPTTHGQRQIITNNGGCNGISKSKNRGRVLFFTVALADRSSDLLIAHIDTLRAAFKAVKASHPFTINAIVILPEHLHCLWTLPSDDDNYSARWMLIKRNFSLNAPKTEAIKSTRLRKRELGVGSVVFGNIVFAMIEII